MGDALCAQVDPELFFPDNGGAHARGAKRVCAACPVTAQCLDYALELEAQQGVAVWGVWGGTTEMQRRTMRRRDKPSNRAGRVAKAGRLARAGCTRGEIADELNVHRDTVRRYLRGAP
jgi:DNA-binding NarL/FixJ family response regulator